jgi:uncharacterized protein YjbI with pentapeptide repeats
VALTELVPADVGDLVAGADLELREFRGLDLAGSDANAARLLECVLVDCRLDGVLLGGARVLGSELSELRATTLGAVRSTWRDVTMTGCRFGAFDATSSSLTDVRISGGKFDFMNLRGATMTRVVVEDCLIGELHLAGASLRTVRFADCRIDSLEMRNATAAELDLRGADLRVVDGVEHLRGARISEAQLQQLAPALAEHVGLLVGDPPAVRRSRPRA